MRSRASLPPKRHTKILNTPAKSIWIDLDNSPHVPLFAPIIRHYRGIGFEVIVTVRDHAQTVELLKLNGIDDFAVIGRHYGKGAINKVRGLLVRSRQLATDIVGRSAKPAVAISHGSRSLVLAAWWLKIPVITMYDYEWTETGIFNRFSDRVLVPERIPDDILDQINLPEGKRVKYRGLKEETYVRDFKPDLEFRRRFFEEHDAADKSVLVVLRPPATSANYHSPEGDRLLTAILKVLSEARDTLTAILPRTRNQAEEIRTLITTPANFLILETPVNGLDLINAADLVISGGGTMNREAALLGVPVYSIFAGRQGSLDDQMEREGLIRFIRQMDDVENFEIKKRDRGAKMPVLTDRVERFVIDQIDQYLQH